MPYPSDAAVKAETPVLTFSFDKPAQLDGIAINLVNTLKGIINIQFLKNGTWHSAVTVDGRELTTG